MCLSEEENYTGKTGREQLNTYHWNHRREIRGWSKGGAEGFQGPSGGRVNRWEQFWRIFLIVSNCISITFRSADGRISRVLQNWIEARKILLLTNVPQRKKIHHWFGQYWQCFLGRSLGFMSTFSHSISVCVGFFLWKFRNTENKDEKWNLP